MARQPHKAGFCVIAATISCHMGLSGLVIDVLDTGVTHSVPT